MALIHIESVKNCCKNILYSNIITHEFRIFIDYKYSHCFSQFSQGKTPVSLKRNIGRVFALKLRLKLVKCAVSQVKGGTNFELKINP